MGDMAGLEKGLSLPLQLPRAPLNEDVFTPPAPSLAPSLDSDIQELSEQIHRLLLQVSIVKGSGMKWSVRKRV